jgi:hypothetical protein
LESSSRIGLIPRAIESRPGGFSEWIVIPFLGAEVSISTPNGSCSSLIYLTLATRKGKRSGDIEWNEQQCGVAFVVKPD